MKTKNIKHSLLCSSILLSISAMANIANADTISVQAEAFINSGGTFDV